MPVFTYEAVAGDGRKVRGLLRADTARLARDELRERGLSVADLTIFTGRSGALTAWLRSFRRARRFDQVTSFTSHLSVLLSVGVRLVDALRTLAEQHKPIEKIIRSLEEDVSGGKRLSEALGGFPSAFDEVYVSVARVAEASGTLAETLGRLARFRETVSARRQKVGSALMYPLILVLVGIGVVAFLTSYVLPKIIGVLEASGRPLPPVTAVLMRVAEFVGQTWWALILGALCVVLLFQWAVRRPGGRRIWHGFLMRVPVAGDLFRKQSIARFAGLLKTLLASGVTLPDSLQVLTRTVDNQVLSEEIERLRVGLVEGSTVSALIKGSRCFDPVVVRMLGVGEETGELEGLLENLASAYERDVERATTRFVTVLEPALIVTLAGAIGFILYAVLMPILEASRIV